MPSTNSPFLDSIYQIRTEECLIIYSKILDISQKEKDNVVEFLMNEFDNEKINYPFQSPKFNAKAALFGAEILYHAAQFVAIRENTEKDFKKNFPIFEGIADESAMLSADLCLRFLPIVFQQLKSIDDHDPLLEILINIFQKFHYSAVGLNIDFPEINWENTIMSSCFKMLYLNKIFEYKNYELAENPFWKKEILANLGDYKNVFWRELK
ncbi:hypothetical protein [Frigoriflavimonas asaccharolytica]|uniref:MoxR-vWA-beta-propeller ternary system domain-containing protein n=1 Tax=Frigoriflavimonas asaccharolytica TaxID=2735899 RepID=A0A8J8KCH6_9FLAO|nr:hypothetical protein [Frigoriflavimonas asaccharolytica]NRS93649.1 hypothetical protein [Frigoriflavimonas asaccharolytica]